MFHIHTLVASTVQVSLKLQRLVPKTFIPFISNYLCRLVLKIIRSYCELHNSPSGFFLRFKVLGMAPLTAQAA